MVVRRRKDTTMNTDKALKKMRAFLEQLERFDVDLSELDSEQSLAETWDAVTDLTDALSADIARLESGDIA